MRRILYISEASTDTNPNSVPLFLQKFSGDYEISRFSLPFSSTPRQIRKIVFGNFRMKDHDLVVTTSYPLSFAVCLRKAITGFRGKHVAVGLNLSRRPITSRHAWLKAIPDRLFTNLDVAIVHSAHEADLFSDLHGLQREKLAFAHWGYDLPAERGSMFDTYPKPFFCMIGRNNRDHATFLRTMATLPARGVMIIPGYARLDGLEIPGNVDVFTDLDPAECLNCQKNALANLILVQDEMRGAGHITAVSGLHLGVPQVASDALPLREYLIGGKNAFLVPLHHPAALQRVLERLLDDPTIAAPLIRQGRQLADRWMTAEASARRLSDIIRATLDGRRPAFFDPDWPAWRAGLTATGKTPPG